MTIPQRITDAAWIAFVVAGVQLAAFGGWGVPGLLFVVGVTAGLAGLCRWVERGLWR